MDMVKEALQPLPEKRSLSTGTMKGIRLSSHSTRNRQRRWKSTRDEVTSWSTPIIIEQAGKPQVIVSGTSRVRGYELESGKVIWECGGLSSNIVASSGIR